MPQKRKGARLYLRKGSGGREPEYIIRDSGRPDRRTGCGPRDLQRAEEALATYIAARQQQDAAQNRHRDPAAVPVADVLLAYWNNRSADVARPAEFQARLRRLNEALGSHTVDDITEALLRSYAKGRSASAARRELQDLRAAIRMAADGRLIQYAVPVWMPAKAAPRERWLTRDEAAKLIWNCWRYRETQKGKPGRYTRRHVAIYILVGIYTGTRAAAICQASLTPQPGRGYVDLDSGRFWRTPPGERVTKKRKPTITMPPRLTALLRRHFAAEKNRRKSVGRAGPCHVIEWNGKAVGDVDKAFARACAAVGIHGVSPHTLRHTCATWGMQNGADPWELCGMLGMTMETLERVYGHHSPDHMTSVHKAFSQGRRRKVA